MKQIVVGQWDGREGNNFSIIGLSEEGDIFKFEKSQNGWVPYPMNVSRSNYDNVPQRKSNKPYPERTAPITDEDVPF